jgi:Zn-dependent protease
LEWKGKVVKGSLQIGKVFGIPIGINYSWFIIFALVTLSLTTGYFPSRYAGWEPVSYWGIGLLTSLFFFASVLIHELAHSVVALAWGVPVKSITLFIFGGVANIGREPERPLSEFLIAIAGPGSSLLLALGFGVLWLTGQFVGWAPLAALGLYLGGINLSLALFNLLPGFPLDGGRIFRSIVWAGTGNMNRATRWAAATGRAVAVLMIIGGGVLIVTGNWGSGLWLAFIGWFLDSAASHSAQQAWVREALEGYTAGDFASSVCQAVDSNMPLDWVVRDYVLTQGQNCFVVTEGKQAQGVATLGQIQKVPRQRWGWTPVRQIMTPLSHLKPVGAGEAAYSVLERMMAEGQSLLPVVDGNRFLGLVRRENLLHFAQTRTSLGV